MRISFENQFTRPPYMSKVSNRNLEKLATRFISVYDSRKKLVLLSSQNENVKPSSEAFFFTFLLPHSPRFVPRSPTLQKDAEKNGRRNKRYPWAMCDTAPAKHASNDLFRNGAVVKFSRWPLFVVKKKCLYFIEIAHVFGCFEAKSLLTLELNCFYPNISKINW